MLDVPAGAVDTWRLSVYGLCGDQAERHFAQCPNRLRDRCGDWEDMLERVEQAGGGNTQEYLYHTKRATMVDMFLAEMERDLVLNSDRYDRYAKAKSAIRD